MVTVWWTLVMSTGVNMLTYRRHLAFPALWKYGSVPPRRPRGMPHHTEFFSSSESIRVTSPAFPQPFAHVLPPVNPDGRTSSRCQVTYPTTSPNPHSETFCSAIQERPDSNVVLACSVPSSGPVSFLDSQKYTRCRRVAITVEKGLYDGVSSSSSK